MLSTTRHAIRITYLEDNIRCEATCGYYCLGIPFDLRTNTRGTLQEAQWVSLIRGDYVYTFANLEDLLKALLVAERKG